MSYSLSQALGTGLPMRQPSAFAWSSRKIICRLASKELEASTTKKRPNANGMASSILFLSACKLGSSDSFVTKLTSNHSQSPLPLFTQHSQRSKFPADPSPLPPYL